MGGLTHGPSERRFGLALERLIARSAVDTNPVRTVWGEASAEGGDGVAGAGRVNAAHAVEGLVPGHEAGFAVEEGFHHARLSVGTPVPLIAFVSPVEPPLRTAFLTRYRILDIERSLPAVRFPNQTPPADCVHRLDTNVHRGAKPVRYRRGPRPANTGLDGFDTTEQRRGFPRHLILTRRT
jgi:hypothetical protein